MTIVSTIKKVLLVASTYQYQYGSRSKENNQKKLRGAYVATAKSVNLLT